MVEHWSQITCDIMTYISSIWNDINYLICWAVGWAAAYQATQYLSWVELLNRIFLFLQKQWTLYCSARYMRLSLMIHGDRFNFDQIHPFHTATLKLFVFLKMKLCTMGLINNILHFQHYAINRVFIKENFYWKICSGNNNYSFSNSMQLLVLLNSINRTIIKNEW